MTTEEDARAATAFDRKLGQRIRTKRHQLQMSQQELAKALGVTFQQVQKYESGHNRISVGRLKDIATALDIPVARLFDVGEGRSVSPQVTEKVEELLATAEGQELMALFLSIGSVKVRRKLLELARALAKKS